jgi:prevent-host-death family protein
MATVTVHAAKTQLSKLIARALEGEEVIIARGTVPVVRLVPVTPKPRRQSGVLKGKLHVPDSFFEPMSEEELRLWEGGEE